MTRQQFFQWLEDPARPPLLMGVLNVTPDSFSDGSRFLDPSAAIAHAHRLVAEGADLLDIGAESTRPGSQPTPAETQIERLLPVLEGIGGRIPCALSVDTTQSAVARVALERGVAVINDISAAQDDPDMLPLAARSGAALVLMHMQGTPATMQLNPRYIDVVGEIAAHLAARRDAAIAAGVSPHRILLDPGLGFGKTLEHNLAILRHLRRFRELGRPLVVGTSRKGFVGRVTGEHAPADRLMGTAATVAWSVANGADLLRVHDVEQMGRVVRMIRAIQG